MPRLTPSEIGDLFDAQAPALRLYLRQWLDEASAQDLVQECFIQLIRERRPPDEPRPWLFRVARNKAMNWIRSHNRRVQRETKLVETEAGLNVGWFDSAASQVESQEAEVLLNQLDPLERETVILKIWGDCTFEQVAKVLDLSISKAHRTYQKALQEIRSQLEHNPASQPQFTGEILKS